MWAGLNSANMKQCSHEMDLTRLYKTRPSLSLVCRDRWVSKGKMPKELCKLFIEREITRWRGLWWADLWPPFEDSMSRLSCVDEAKQNLKRLRSLLTIFHITRLRDMYQAICQKELSTRAGGSSRVFIDPGSVLICKSSYLTGSWWM